VPTESAAKVGQIPRKTAEEHREGISRIGDILRRWRLYMRQFDKVHKVMVEREMPMAIGSMLTM
jgi:hypothetical protein